MSKLGFFELFKLPKLISGKIWVAEKLLYSHIFCWYKLQTIVYVEFFKGEQSLLALLQITIFFFAFVQTFEFVHSFSRIIVLLNYFKNILHQIGTFWTFEVLKFFWVGNTVHQLPNITSQKHERTFGTQKQNFQN